MPATWPMIQALGSGFGQNGSTWNCGTVWAKVGRGGKQDHSRQPTTGLASRHAWWSPTDAAGGPTVVQRREDWQSMKRQIQPREENRKMRNDKWRADPLVWGHGATVFEVFLESRPLPHFPHVKAFGQARPALRPRPRSERGPSHPSSSRLSLTALAHVLGRYRALHPGGLDFRRRQGGCEIGHGGGRRSSREEFEFDRHCGGPNLETTPNAIIRRIEGHSGVQLAEAFAIPDLDREVKWHCKYARQNGIHVSPTFMVDGLVRAGMSSGDFVADWASGLSA